MRKPETIERLYLDFDGFFASVEQQADKRLRGKPVGVVPYEGGVRSSVIAVSREAKMFGVKNVMSVVDAKKLCPDMVLVVQKPDLYRRANNAILAELEAIIPIDAVKSIDELTCVLDDEQRADPELLTYRIRARLRENIGQFITCSVGYAANRQLAKMACKAGKKSEGRYGSGLAIWHPQEAEQHLFKVKLDDVPGVGSNMFRKLMRFGIYDTEMLYNTQPKQMRKIWNNVTGERLWYALHGYDIQAPESQRGAFGHARVLPPEARSMTAAYEIARLLLVKAARRLRRENYYCSGLWIWLSLRQDGWTRTMKLPMVNDDQAVLSALKQGWDIALRDLGRTTTPFRVGVTLVDLTPAGERQTDLLLADDVERQRWEKASAAVDALNSRYSGTVVSVGDWKPPKGGNVGGKISFTRIPSAEDFW
ncbi:Y-family DNA polymerase [Limoniibacter endophyticus]|uniref:DNA-directed DNA polymerase n=1 Tax=Limoniibacter endophyticus TaxID=1565040 RepID=A0A8J3DLG0_9HYPH|nr:type VI secretion protein ImpB [Limoniibacter endophyticus]GHC61507.1 DNA polymerase IV [Limoniibacter endophyticus]